MNNINSITDKLDEIAALIHKAQIELGNGKVTSLTNLDNEVSQICQQVLALPASDAKKIQPMMADIIGKLEILAIALQTFQSDLKKKT